MAKTRRSSIAVARARKLQEAMSILQSLGFGAKQCNEAAGYTFLALLDLAPMQPWGDASNPLRGITPIISFIREVYGVSYAPNTRETIRDEAVKYFVEAAMLIRNPDDPARPTNSGKTVYQIEKRALETCGSFGKSDWQERLESYLASREYIQRESKRSRALKRISVALPSGEAVTLSPGGQNPLIKKVIEEFCPRFSPGGIVVYIGDAEDKFLHLDASYLAELGVAISAPTKMPDLVVHDSTRSLASSTTPVFTSRKRPSSTGGKGGCG